MSGSTSRCRACGKINYPSKRAATQALTKLKQADREGPDGPMVVYPCPARGSKWHLGHTDTMEGRAVREGHRGGHGGKPPVWDAAEWDVATLTLWSRSRGRCDRADCAGPIGQSAERHHRQRRAVGGDRLANLVLLHSECHAWAHAHPEEARQLGLIVSAHEDDPATVPLATPSGPVLLNDDGGCVPLRMPPGDDPRAGRPMVREL